MQRRSTISGKSHESLLGDKGGRGIQAEGTDCAKPQRKAEEWPKGVHAPILGIREHSHYMAKGTLQMNLRTKTLKERDHLSLLGWDNVITRILKSRKEGPKGQPNRRVDGRRDGRDAKLKTDLTHHC